MRLMDVLFAFPVMLLAIGIIAVLGPHTYSAAAAIAVVYTPIFARLLRGPALVLCESEYVAGARAIGASDARIIFMHILPNLASVVLVQTSLLLSAAILVEASLSFLGLGTQPPTPSLGFDALGGPQLSAVVAMERDFRRFRDFVSVVRFQSVGRCAARYARSAPARAALKLRAASEADVPALAHVAERSYRSGVRGHSRRGGAVDPSGRAFFAMRISPRAWDRHVVAEDEAKSHRFPARDRQPYRHAVRRPAGNRQGRRFAASSILRNKMARAPWNAFATTMRRAASTNATAGGSIANMIVNFAGRSRSFVFYMKEERTKPSRRCRRSRCDGPHIIVEQNQVGAIARSDPAQLVIEPRETSRD